MLKTIDIDLEFAPIIDGPPVSPKDLHKQSASNDEITVESWKDVWVKAVQENHASKGPFTPNGIGKLFEKLQGMGCVVVGSGPSLKTNILDLIEVSKKAPVISCLHNFHYLEDHGVEVDYYVTLDSGPVTVEEVSEGGTRTPDEYWALTANRTLLAFIGANPTLISKWQGDIYWFHCPIPSDPLMKKIEEVERFNTYVSTGGNVLGAAFYIAKAIMAAPTIIFVGADFSFSYDKKFHGWASKYDASLGHAFKVPDIFGNRRYTWQSYYNFKSWFDYVATSCPGIYINATEGGCLGAYEGGNIRQIIQMSLNEVAKMFSHHEHMREQCENPQMEISKEKQVKLLF